ncbi:hypothetical protein V6N11_008953 [Hibiscus sabdariffa]|uniref:RNase H type-1 domain-containing protein n=1 Tax=Hibiscus sabdariffa TaxID=183260 RepID=A0ABR2PP58_9ROSI
MKSDGNAGGIGGVLRNDTRVRLIIFSVRIGAGPPILAELLAIKHNIELFQNSQWNGKSKLILESDCKVAIDPIKTPVCFSSLITSIAGFITNGWTCIRHIPRAEEMYIDEHIDWNPKIDPKILSEIKSLSDDEDDEKDAVKEIDWHSIPLEQIKPTGWDYYDKPTPRLPTIIGS